MIKKLIQSSFLLFVSFVLINCGSNNDTVQTENNTNCAVTGSANKTISVLLVGNSLMNGIQSKIEELLICGGYTANIGISNPGGYRLYQHDAYAPTLTEIEKGYDFVLLQEQSGSITGHPFPYDVINSLKTKIEAAGSQMGLYQTWAFSSRDPVVTEDIISRYEIIGAYFNLPVFHIGRAWDYFYTSYSENPPFSLFSDSVHANTYGQGLITFMLYARLTGESPVYLSSLSLTDEEAYELQVIAWDTYNAY